MKRPVLEVHPPEEGLRHFVLEIYVLKSCGLRVTSTRRRIKTIMNVFLYLMDIVLEVHPLEEGLRLEVKNVIGAALNRLRGTSTRRRIAAGGESPRPDIAMSRPDYGLSTELLGRI